MTEHERIIEITRRKNQTPIEIHPAQGAARSWSMIDDFMQEVAEARLYDGVHYRISTEVGTAMGKQVGALAVANYLRSSK
jgi:hypothetical protein